ncbi:hypothetical protein MML48_3g00013472 [Holotrichia oblita]|uniref:Uncharacterized protein n=1 Tax=Holotrichia oblita TaxID=644536 RepID=A0ACB9TE50_HOLOL|nr:hypothetical protein MML48_3g00013472 [Holotrichia oblita]
MSTDSGGAPAPPVSELNKTFWKDEFVHDKMASGVPMDQDTIEVENIGSQVEVRSMETLDTEEGIHSERINIQTEEPKALTIIEDEPFYYTGQDQTPYQVYVESIDKNIGQLRDMAFGSLLMKAKVEGVKVIERRGRNRLAVEFSSMTAANLFLKSSFIKNNELRAFIPRHLISCKGIIRRIDPNLSDEFILENIKTSTGRDVLQVKRMKRKKDSEDSTEIEYVNTASVIVTFRGKSLPNYITLCYNVRAPEPYVIPVIQCFKCCRYGHVQQQCRSAARCPACSKNHNLSECPNSQSPVCISCRGPHLSTERYIKTSQRTCPEFNKQKKIKELMASYNYSFYEASKISLGGNETGRTFRLNDDEIFPRLGPITPPPQIEVDNISFPPSRRKNLTFSKTVQSNKRPQEKASSFHSHLLNTPNGRVPENPTKRLRSNEHAGSSQEEQPDDRMD